MAVYQSFTYSPTELAEQMTSATHDTLHYLAKNKYITAEQYNELSGKLVVMAVQNRKGFGQRLKEYLFGNSEEENAWVFPIAEISTHYKSALPDKPNPVTKIKPKLEVVKDE